MSRFLAQGTSAHDLSRVTALVTPQESIVRVIALGRLSLFGPGATRLHDEIVTVVASWFESGGPKHLKPLEERAAVKILGRLDEIFGESPSLDRVPKKIQARLAACASEDFAELWKHVKVEADERSHQAEAKLKRRGAAEAAALRKILEDQRTAIQQTIAEKERNDPWLRARDEFADGEQNTLFGVEAENLLLPFRNKDKVIAAEREQFEQDRRYMAARLAAIEKEIEDEPPQIAELYRIVRPRLEAVGLIYLWPETRA
jgi:capsule polysaccharide export protein KpsE/RkpR